MVAKTAWLDGYLRWEAGRVVWGRDGAFVAPDAAALGQAQRAHYKIRRYPISADLALGDHRAWLARRAERLALAKLLRNLAVPDLDELARQAAAGDTGAIEQLVALLTAEALCANQLPISPARALMRCGAAAGAPLAALANAPAQPLAVRILAALTLGALGHLPGGPYAAAPQQLRRAQAWGGSHGLTDDPGLLAQLLVPSDGYELARRWLAARQAAGPLALTHDLLRDLLADGHTAALVVELAEATLPAAALAERLRETRMPSIARPEREAFIARLAELLHEAARATAEPGALGALAALAGSMLELASLGPLSAEQLAAPIERSLSELGPLAGAGMALLAEHHVGLWQRASYTPGKRHNGFAAWLAERLHDAELLLRAMSQVGDAQLTREALALDVELQLRILATYGAKTYRWALGVVRACDQEPPGLPAEERRHYQRSRREVAGTLAWMLGWLGGRREALQPLTDALMAVPRDYREDLLSNISSELNRTGSLNRDNVTRIARRIAHIARFARESKGYSYACSWFLLALLALDRSLPVQADAWLAWLVGELLATEQRQGEQFATGSISIAALFGATLADGDLRRFQAIVRAGLAHRFGQEQDLLERSIAALNRLPGLRSALAQVFAQQPHRCAELTTRVGMAARLGTAVISPLRLLEPLAGQPDQLEDLSQASAHSSEGSRAWLLTAQPEWRVALDLAPELAPGAASYLYSRWVCGQDTAVPAGVRQALEQPIKLAREAEHLSGLVAEQPERPALARRLANLRARLADGDQILGYARLEAGVRLAQAAALARLAAAEELALACYRVRLTQIAGWLPEAVALDDDLLNAIQLSTDISHNRRLLRWLLRARLRGELGWRERIPANATFLAELERNGADPQAWQGAWPRRARVAGLRGGTLHLRLATEPLSVLQMGNPFGTCLSLGGINAHSAVANAVDLNKRVLFGRDGDGRIVTRALVAVNSQGRLVRFRTYTDTDDAAVRGRLCEAVRRYLLDFAARCGLQTAEDGEVPRLASEVWYDDGTIGWDEEEPAQAEPSPRSHRRALKAEG